MKNMNLLQPVYEYIEQTQPFDMRDFELKELASGEYNVNFLLTAKEQKYVVRVSVSQLSGAKDQLQKEYDILDYLKGRDIAPQPYFIDMAGFQFPIMIEEFIEGPSLVEFNDDVLDKIGAMIARINNVSIQNATPFEYRTIDYLRDIADHQKTYDSLTPNEHNKRWFHMLDGLFDLVKITLGNKHPIATSMLIRRDANPNNFILTGTDIRMVDWEIARVDDPTITIASFINEVTLYDVLSLNPSAGDIEKVKDAFKRDCYFDNFEGLLHNRLVIEELGGLVWALERIDTLLKDGAKREDFDSKLAWYQKVADLSLNALNDSLTKIKNQT